MGSRYDYALEHNFQNRTKGKHTSLFSHWCWKKVFFISDIWLLSIGEEKDKKNDKDLGQKV